MLNIYTVVITTALLITFVQVLYLSKRLSDTLQQLARAENNSFLARLSVDEEQSGKERALGRVEAQSVVIQRLRNEVDTLTKQNVALIDDSNAMSRTIATLETTVLEMQQTIEAGEIKTVRFEGDTVDAFVVYKDSTQPHIPPFVVGVYLDGVPTGALSRGHSIRSESLICVDENTFVRSKDLDVIRRL